MDELKLIKPGLYSLASLSFVAGAVRGFQESNGMVSDPTIDSVLINAGALGPAGIGALVGTAIFAPAALVEDGIDKIGGLVAIAAMGSSVGGVAGYSGVGLGYLAGRIVGEVFKYS